MAEIGKPVILVDSHPIPEPGPNQIQVRVTVAGLNPHDRKARDTGIFIAENLPAVLANDVVGRVTKIGTGVGGFSVGDRVVSQAGLSSGSTQNGLQEYALADVGAAARISDWMTDDEAATLPCNLIAPLIALFSVLEIPPPWSAEARTFDYATKSILIVGGGSNCGKFAVQLAKLANIGRIVVVGGKPAEMKSFGATHVIDRHRGYTQILGEIKAVVGDDLIYAFDTVNPPGGQILAADALSGSKRGGLARLVPEGPIDETKLHGKNAGFEIRDVFGVSQAHRRLSEEFWRRLPDYLSIGSIKPLGYVVQQGLTADGVNEVLDRYREGAVVVKTHVHVGGM